MQKINDFLIKYLKNNKISNLKDFCQNEDIEILEANITSAKGFCLTCFDQKYIILNDTLTPLTRDFVIAHELGHGLLHNDDLIYLKKNTLFSGSKLEEEANYFAGKVMALIDNEYILESESDYQIMETLNSIKYK